MIGERVCYAIVFAVEAVITWFYCSSIYPRKISRAMVWISFTAGYLMLFLMSDLDIVALNLAGFFLVNLSLLTLDYRCSIKLAVLHAAFLSFCNGASEVIVNMFLVSLGHGHDAYTYSFTIMLALMILSKLLYVLVIFIASRILRPGAEAGSQSPLIWFLCILPLVSAFIVVTITYIGMTSKLSFLTELMITVSMLALLIVNLAVLILYGRIQEIAAENTALNISKAHDAAMAEHYMLLCDQYDSQRIMIHDIRKHLAFINDMLMIGDVPEAERYIDQLEAMPSLKRTVKLCNDPLLNVILSRYMDQANDMSISFQCEIKSSDFSFMDSTSIVALFSNLLSNAIEAAARSQKKLMELTILKVPEEEYIMVAMENSCDIPPKTDGNGSFVTSKKDRSLHGYGLKSIDRVVEDHGGISTYHYDPITKTFQSLIRFPIPQGKNNDPNVQKR